MRGRRGYYRGCKLNQSAVERLRLLNFVSRPTDHVRIVLREISREVTGRNCYSRQCRRAYGIRIFRISRVRFCARTNLHSPAGCFIHSSANPCVLRSRAYLCAKSTRSKFLRRPVWTNVPFYFSTLICTSYDIHFYCQTRWNDRPTVTAD